MRKIALGLSLAMALPMIPAMATANTNGCHQLRLTVENRAPLTLRNLPYDALSCGGISQIYSLIVLRSTNTHGRLEDRIEAVFRRQGLIR
ncbi:hypothetical protein [Gymnodinialimonas ulvae]|uniref:hypothetical protein n=1 Tax=Gymnodinialimonas ulvae TaxID=3126504 RepID=UPI003095282B